jgi:hypothetical protein
MYSTPDGERRLATRATSDMSMALVTNVNEQNSVEVRWNTL